LGFISSAGIAAFLAPCFIWYIMIERRERISVSRGITVGALGAALAHFVCWYLFLLSNYIEKLYLGKLTEYVLGPLEGILAALTYSFVSLLLFGLIILPIGALIGGCYATHIKETQYKTLLKRVADILKVL
jgi:ABC-type Na+ efflux pump permease subunit